METNKFVLLKSKDITKDDIKKICALERKYYNLPVEQQFSVRKTASLHRLNNDDLVVLKDTEKDQIVGFTSMIPVRWACYKKIRSGKYLDTIINTNNVKAYDNPGFYNLYISSVIIDKENYSYSALRLLLDGVFQKAWSLAVFKSIFIRNILADTITKDGEKLCKHLGFTKIRKTDHNSTIFEYQMITNANYVEFFKHNAFSLASSLTYAYKRYLETSKFSYKVNEAISNTGSGLKSFFRYVFKERPRNKKLLKKYPFLRYRPECTEGFDAVPYFKKHPYRKTFLDEMPIGWRKAFSIQMCEDIRNRILDYDREHGTDFLHEYSLSQIKEKWATLCWYDNGTPADLDLDDIISYYEDLSNITCIVCGKQPTKYATLGWINFVCEDCKNNELRDPNAVRKLTWDDISVRRSYDAKTETWTDVESKIDFKKYWDKPEEE